MGLSADACALSCASIVSFGHSGASTLTTKQLSFFAAQRAAYIPPSGPLSGYENYAQVAVHRVVAAEEQAEILMHAPLFRGEYPCKLLRLTAGDAADAQRAVDIDVFKPVLRFVPVRNVLVNERLILPAVFKDDGYQRAQEKRVRTEGGHDVHIRHARGLRKARVNDDDHLVGVFGKLAADSPCSGYLVGNV